MALLLTQHINRMYVTNLNSHSVSVIDTNSDTVVDTIMVCNGPYGIAFDSTHNRIWT